MLRSLCAVVWSASVLCCASAEAQVAFTHCFGPPLNEPVDLFVAMNNGWLDGRVTVRDQYHGKIILQNLTRLPLQIALPQFAGARPVLAQQGFPFSGPSGQFPGGGPSGAPQPVGGSPSSRNGGNPFGSGPFNIAPEQVRIVDFRCFCLEQGKPDPRSAVKYELVPLATVNDDPRLPKLLAAYAAGDVDREAAQAAVWHAANDLSWNDLAVLSQRLLPGVERPLFNARQLRQARLMVESAERQLAAAKAAASQDLAKVVKPPRL